MKPRINASWNQASRSRPPTSRGRTEPLHYYSAEGMVEQRIWRGFERQVSEVISLPGVQQWWDLRRDWFSDGFQAYLDELIAAGPTVEPQTCQDHACLP